MNSEQVYLMMEHSNTRTNHLLHLILTVLTSGLWLIVWLIAMRQTTKKRQKLAEQARKSGQVHVDTGVRHVG